VGAEEGRHELDRVQGGGARDGAQRLEFGGRVEAVAALALDRRRALLQEAVEAHEQSLDELVLAGLAHAAQAGEDAAAAARDLGVGRAARAQLELVLARAREDGVRVRVDETR